MGSAFGGTVGSFVGVAVGITAGQCANVWTVARTVALIAAIYGHDVDDTDVQVKKAFEKKGVCGGGLDVDVSERRAEYPTFHHGNDGFGPRVSNSPTE